MSISTTPPAVFAKPRDLRLAIRRGEFTGPTAGHAPGYVQTNVVILPADAAADFERFCRANDRPCPLVAVTEQGNSEPAGAALEADLRTDVPRYRVFIEGQLQPGEPTDVCDLWRDDFVGFLIGCSFTFETALIRAGLPVRHIDQGRNVPMYQTSLACQPAGDFAGPLVVSMRPFAMEQIDKVIEITGRFPTMHGEPIHIGDPSIISIENLSRPDFGDAVTIEEHEIPVFWACGVTPQLALAAARPSIAITHSPGCMFVTDLTDDAFASRMGEVVEEMLSVSLQPIGLSLVEGNRLRIQWSDGQTRDYGFRELRDACPCATCREKRNAPEATAASGQKLMSLPVLSAAEARPLVIEDMKPVGSYAYSIAFSDGHNTGIYTLEHLRELGHEVGAA